MKKVSILILLFSVGIGNLYAQSALERFGKRVVKRAGEQVEQRVERKAEEGVEKAMDKAEEAARNSGKEKEKPAKSENAKSKEPIDIIVFFIFRSHKIQFFLHNAITPNC